VYEADVELFSPKRRGGFFTRSGVASAEENDQSRPSQLSGDLKSNSLVRASN
jgi:hypothetical protein